VSVEVTAARARVAGVVQLKAPSGWTISPASQPFRLAAPPDRAHVAFTVTPPAGPTTGSVEARVEIDGMRFNQQRIEVRYEHLPFQLLHPPATLKALSLDLAIRGRRVGYLPGAGDEVAGALEQMGYAVARLNGDGLTAENLRTLDAVVIGIRAFNVRTDLAAHLPGLFAYVEAGGTLVAQYNVAQGLKEDWLAPVPAADLPEPRDRRARAGGHSRAGPSSSEHSQPHHPDDFEDWAQERGLYFPERWDERFTPLLATGDPGETPLRGGLLVARYGKGHFVYTSLAWFRQLPEGVPGPIGCSPIWSPWASEAATGRGAVRRRAAWCARN
jgi:hypothetical protein